MAHGELLWRAIVSGNIKIIALVVVGVIAANYLAGFLSNMSAGSSASSTGGQ
jgi:hypothetical protein